MEKDNSAKDYAVGMVFSIGESVVVRARCGFGFIPILGTKMPNMGMCN